MPGSRADRLKRAAAAAAIDRLPENGVLGIGTGSTVNQFIELLGECRERFEGAVSSSEESSRRLAAIGLPQLDLNDVGELAVYVDGADEANARLELIKGGGGALTREKIIAQASERFICIADESKRVETLGRFPLPVEVIPMARALVVRRLRALGGEPSLREGFVTDNGNQILDVHGLSIPDPPALESRINQIPGVVTNGLFALRPADVLLLAGEGGVRALTREG